jgi:hypothetical protein
VAQVVKALLSKCEAQSYQKNEFKKTQKTRGVAQVVEHLPSKYEALISNANITKTKKMAPQNDCDCMLPPLGVLFLFCSIGI